MADSVSYSVDKLVDEHADALYAYAINRVDNSEQAKDLVQDTFLAALKGFGQFEGKSAIRTWLIAILKRKIIDLYRQQEARKTIPLSHFFREKGRKGHWNENAAPAGKYSQIEDEIENKELNQTLQTCLDQLPGKWKGIVLDKLIEEKESDEVCKEHEISSSNLWVIVHRAKLQLRECLERKWLNT